MMLLAHALKHTQLVWAHPLTQRTSLSYQYQSLLLQVIHSMEIKKNVILI